MNPFDDIIQEKANSHQAPVPPGAWDNIIKKEKKRRYLFFWWILALLICGLTIAGYYVYNEGKKDELVAAEKKLDKFSPVTEYGKINESNSIEDKKEDKIKPVETKTAGIINGREPEEINKIVSGSKDAELIVVNSDKKAVTIIDKTDQVETNDLAASNKKTVANKKRGSKAINTDKNITITALNNKNKKNISSNNSNLVVNSKDKTSQNDAGSWSAKNRITKKDKGRTAVKITAPGTEEPIVTTEIKENSIAKNETGKNDEQKNDLAKDISNAVDQSLLKKQSDPDSVKKKITITAQEENKKAVPIAKKQKHKEPWFIDAAIAPVFPIQQYDRSTTFNRTLVENNSQTAFSGRLVSTGIDPSLAFSIGLRKKLNKRFYLGIGFQYIELKENIHIAGTETKTNYNIIDVLDNSGGSPHLIRDTFVTVTQGTRDINAVNSYQFFDIPVFLQYTLVQKRSWSLNAVAGVQVNIASRYKNELNRDSIAPLVSSSPSAAKTTIGFSVYGGFRFAKPIGKKFEFFCLPFIDINVGRQNIKNSLINKKIQQAGLSLGLSYRLNN